MPERRPFTITLVRHVGNGIYTANVNGVPVRMLNPLGGWVGVESRRELLPHVQAELNRKVRSARKAAVDG